MLSVKVAGRWLSTLAAYGPVTVEYGPHGSEAASWDMDPGFRHPSLRGNAPVIVFDGGAAIWAGTLNEPGSDGAHSARGLWQQAQDAPTLNASGDATTYVSDAIAQAMARGDVTWSGGSDAFPFAPWTPTMVSSMTLAQLLDGYCAEAGTRWFVDGAGVVSHAADPTTPRWVVPHAVAGRGLTPAEDEFFTHAAGRYLDSATGLYKTVIVGSADAAGHFGRKTELVDLTEMGGIDATKATAVLNGLLLRDGARMGWGEGLELSHGQITTTGGTAAALNQITSLQTVRLAGTVDASRANLFRAYTDITLRTVRYTDGSGVVSMTPFGYAPRTLGDVLKAAVAA